eukprot:scaffold333985_cov15-Prasinocladus_malaysianus.AAC.1
MRCELTMPAMACLAMQNRSCKSLAQCPFTQRGTWSESSIRSRSSRFKVQLVKDHDPVCPY